MSKSVAAGTTYIGSTSFAPALGRCNIGWRYLYLRIWRVWVRLGKQRGLGS